MNQNEIQDKNAIYYYPEYNNPYYVMGLDDLLEDACIILCTNDKTVYTWIGYEFDEDGKTVRLRIPNHLNLTSLVY